MIIVYIYLLNVCYFFLSHTILHSEYYVVTNKLTLTVYCANFGVIQRYWVLLQILASVYDFLFSTPKKNAYP
jgi:hypothetical protein